MLRPEDSTLPADAAQPLVPGMASHAYPGSDHGPEMTSVDLGAADGYGSVPDP